MEIFAKPRNKPKFQRRTKVKFYFDAKAENVRANRIQVQQLLVNLLRNANDAMTVFGEPRQLDDGRRGEAGVLPDDRHHWNTDFRKDVRRHRPDGGDAKKNDQRCQHVESVREPQRKSNNGHDLSLQLGPRTKPCSRIVRGKSSIDLDARQIRDR
jgi:hypothetical protein